MINPAVIHDSWCHDKTLDQQCMLTQARPPMRKHLTSIYYIGRADYIGGFVSSIAFFNFELTRLVMLCVAGLSMLRPLRHPQNISAETQP